MEKEVGKIVFTETENGFRVEVSGKSLKELCGCGCWPMAVGCVPKASECCPPEEKKE